MRSDGASLLSETYADVFADVHKNFFDKKSHIIIISRKIIVGSLDLWFLFQILGTSAIEEHRALEENRYIHSKIESIEIWNFH